MTTETKIDQEKLLHLVGVFINKAWQVGDDGAWEEYSSVGEPGVHVPEDTFKEFSEAMEALDDFLFASTGTTIGWLGYRTKRALRASQTSEAG